MAVFFPPFPLTKYTAKCAFPISYCNRKPYTHCWTIYSLILSSMFHTVNLPPSSRVSSKRPAVENAVAEDLPPETTKRVVLGEMTNFDANKSRRFKAQKSRSKSKANSSTEKKEKEVNVDCGFVFKAGCTDDSNKYAEAPRMYRYLQMLEVEENRRPVPNYMEKVQNDITPRMREVLVDWLTEVADEYKLTADTVYLSVSYVDRFLSSCALNRKKLQLLGVSSMLVASKYEEINPPHVDDFCYMTDNTYMNKEVVDMETDLLKILNYEMGNPTTKSFIRIFTKAAQDNPILSGIEFEYLASYIAELSLLDYNCLRFLPSMVAASAIFLARLTMIPGVCPWNIALEKYTGYMASELEECVLAIHDVQTGKRCTSVKALRGKYMEHKFRCVATLSPPSKIPQHYFDVANGNLVKDAEGDKN